MAHVATTLASAGQQLMQAMLEKNLVDLVKGLRACRRDKEQQYISQAIAEIKEELRSRETSKKARALLKLTYLHMLGYEMSWASFYVVEAMSDSKFSHKRIGYLAASQSFRDTTEVLVLTIQLFKKDLASQNQFEVGLAANCLANICTLDLGRDLGNDVLQLLKSSKPYVRKKAVLALYKVILQFPEALRPAFDRLKEKLEDTDPSVVSAAVNVFCELARKSNPKNYLPLAPVFFKILTTSSNNWVLIKIVKLMSALIPLEPRLAKKLVEPLTSIINSTPAKSLLYECVHAVTACMTDHPQLVKLATEKLRLFVEDPDQNLKYLGLLGLCNLMKTHPQAVVEHKSLIVSCLQDEDVTIRNRALDLVTGMMDRGSSVEVLRLLTDAVARSEPGPFRDATIDKIVATCGADGYERVTNFQWYLQVLADLSRVAHARQSAAVAEQMVDIAVRVKSVRPAAVQLAAGLVAKPRLDAGQDSASASPVLAAAAWIAGELEAPEGAPALLEPLLHPRALALPPAVQAAYVHAATKLFVRSATALAGRGELAAVAARVAQRAGAFAAAPDTEVQERACTLRAVARLAPTLDGRRPGALAALADACREELTPVAARAQRKVPVPEGVDLETPFFEPEPEEAPSAASEKAESAAGDFWGEGGPPPGADVSPAKSNEDDGVSYRPPPPAEGKAERAEREAREAEAARRRRQGDPFYLPGGPGGRPPPSPLAAPAAVPEADLLAGHELPPALAARGAAPSGRRRRGEEPRAEVAPPVEILRGSAMPDGAASASDEDAPRGGLNDVDLTRPGSPGRSQMPTIAPYARPDLPSGAYAHGPIGAGHGGHGGGYGGGGGGGGGTLPPSASYQAPYQAAAAPAAFAAAAAAAEPAEGGERRRHKGSRRHHRPGGGGGGGGEVRRPLGPPAARRPPQGALIDVAAGAAEGDGGPDRAAYAEIGEAAAAAGESGRGKHRSSKGTGEHRSKHKHRSKGEGKS